MRSGLAIAIRIWSKVCGPVGWPKTFINSFIAISSCCRLGLCTGRGGQGSDKSRETCDQPQLGSISCVIPPPSKIGKHAACWMTVIVIQHDRALVVVLRQIDIEA